MKLLLLKVTSSTIRLIISLPKKLTEWIQIRIFNKHTKCRTWKLGKITSKLAIVATYPGTTPIESIRRMMESIKNQGFSVLVIVNENDKKDNK